MYESSQNENMQPIASQIDKIQHKMLHLSKRASKYAISSYEHEPQNH
jgi:hypothetical protein